MMERVNLINKVYCKHIGKSHNVLPLYNYYMPIKTEYLGL
jgi:hypothetical protein